MSGHKFELKLKLIVSSSRLIWIGFQVKIGSGGFEVDLNGPQSLGFDGCSG